MMLAAMLEAGAPVHAQFSYVNTTTLHTNVATSSGSISMPGITTNHSFTTVSSNYTIGDPLATAFGKLNGDFAFIANWMGTNESGVSGLVMTNAGGTYISFDGSTLVLNTNGFGGGGGGGGGSNYLATSFGVGNDLTISNTFTLITNYASGWNLTAITISGPTNCDGSTNSIYTLCQDASSFLFGYLTNACTNIYTPILGTNFPPLLSSIITDPTVSNFVNNAGVTNLLTALSLNQLVQELSAAGLLTNLYAVYPFAAGTPDGDAVNLISNNVNYSITWHGFMATTGAHGAWGVSNNQNGFVSSYGDTGFNPSTISPSVLNNFSFEVWLGLADTSSSTPFIMGSISSGGTGGSYLQSHSSTTSITNDLFDLFINNSSSVGYEQTLTKSGFLGASRTSSNLLSILTEQNGPNDYSVTSTVVSTGNMFIGAVNYSGVGTLGSISTLGFAAFGAGISDSSLTTLKTIVDNYNAKRTGSTFAQYYAISMQAPVTNINYGGATNFFVLWHKYTTNSWIMVSTYPSCGYGGPCFPGPVFLCVPSKKWYVLSSSYTNSPTGSNVCIYCQTH